MDPGIQEPAALMTSPAGVIATPLSGLAMTIK
jgi:hypothetical protein